VERTDAYEFEILAGFYLASQGPPRLNDAPAVDVVSRGFIVDRAPWRPAATRWRATAASSACFAMSGRSTGPEPRGLEQPSPPTTLRFGALPAAGRV
jgi:hypothetical protein